MVKQFLAKTCTNFLPHPPYSPDLAPCNFYLLPFSKKYYWNAVLCHQKMWKQHRIMPWGRLRKMASSSATRSYTNAGKSVSSPKLTTFKVCFSDENYTVWRILHLVLEFLDRTSYNCNTLFYNYLKLIQLQNFRYLCNQTSLCRYPVFTSLRLSRQFFKVPIFYMWF